MLEVALLGTGGMMPLPNRFLTSCVSRLNGKLLLIDCGEGTQVTHRLLGWGYKNISIICFTHFHADHISGLPGFLLAIGNAGRTEPLHLVGPEGLEGVVKCLCVIAPDLPFPLVFHEINYQKGGGELNLFLEGFSIGMLPVFHRCPCFAYRLDINRVGKFDVERAKQLNIPVRMWSFLQKGETVFWEGSAYTPEMVLGGPRTGIRLAYCTDTRPVPNLPAFIQGADLFICEGLYGDEEKKQKTAEHFHMTYSEAAHIACQGGVGQLWLTHFSPAMTHPEEFLHLAKKIFKNTIAGTDRMNKVLLFQD